MKSTRFLTPAPITAPSILQFNNDIFVLTEVYTGVLSTTTQGQMWPECSTSQQLYYCLEVLREDHDPGFIYPFVRNTE